MLGHIISQSGVEVDPEKVRAVRKTKEPSSLKHVWELLGLGGYYEEFIPGYKNTTKPTHRLLNNSNNFERSTEWKIAVTKLKKKFLEIPVLGNPNNRDPYTFTTYASLTGIGSAPTKKQ